MAQGRWRKCGHIAWMWFRRGISGGIQRAVGRDFFHHGSDLARFLTAHIYAHCDCQRGERGDRANVAWQFRAIVWSGH